MTFLRSALFNAVFFGTTFALSVYGIGLLIFAPHRLAGLGTFWARLEMAALRICCNIEISLTGREHLPAEGPALIASQHQSAFDTLVWLMLVPRCSYVVKRELLSIPLFGRLILPSRQIAVDRAAGATALRGMLRDVLAAVRDGRQIVIFPEGTRAPPGELLPLQPVVVALASATRLPVLPVATDSGLCWSRRAFFKFPGTIHIAIQPPIPPGLPREALLERLTQSLSSGAAALARPCG